LRKNGSLPLRVVVRGCDEFSGKSAGGAWISRCFLFGTRCALRITGAHQSVIKRRGGRGLGVFQPNLMKREWGSRVASHALC